MEESYLNFIPSQDISTIDADLTEISYSDSSTENIRELLIMTIDIGDGRSDELTVYESDSPVILAEHFCIKHGMGKDVQHALEEQIKYHIAQIQQEEAQAVSQLFKNQQNFPNNSKSTEKNQQRGRQQNIPSQATHHPKINENSRKLVEGKFVGNIYDRLHKMGQKQPSPRKEQPKPRSVSQKRANNNGDKLYYKGILLKDRTEKKIQQIKQTQIENTMKDLTFQPKTNTKYGNRNPMPEVLLLEKGKEKMQHLEKKRGELLAEEMKKCTFNPKIDHKSSAIARKASTSPDRFMALYDNAKVIEERLNKYSNNLLKSTCPFVPDTSKTSKINRSFSKTSQDQKESKIDSVNDSRIQESIDHITGQPLFQPRIGRPPAKREVKDIGEHLYSFSKKQPSHEARSQSPAHLSNATSEKIVERIKYIRLKEIFESMNPDKNGQINLRTIENSNLSPSIRAILDPLIEELEELNETLNFEEFLESMEMLLKVLSPGEKSVLLMTRKAKPQQQPQYSFKPSLNISNISQESTGESIYDRNIKKIQELESKRKEERSYKEIAEMNECTFFPRTNKQWVSKEINEDSFLDASFPVTLMPIGSNSSYCL